MNLHIPTDIHQYPKRTHRQKKKTLTVRMCAIPYSEPSAQMNNNKYLKNYLLFSALNKHVKLSRHFAAKCPPEMTIRAICIY